MNDLTLSRRRLLELGLGALAVPALGPLAHAAQIEPNLGIMMSTWGAVGMVAEQMKLFQKYGSNTTVTRLDSGTAVRDALVGGRVNIGIVAVSTFITAVDKGQARAIAAVAYSGAANSIMVRDGATGIKTVADLKGRKVASQFGTGSDYTFRTKVLPKFGLTDRDLLLVNVKYQDQVAAVSGGSVDAFVGTEPFPAVAEYNKIAWMLTDFKDYDIVPILLAANRDLLEANPGDTVKFLQAWLAAVDVFKKDPAQANKIVWEIFTGLGYSLPEEVIAIANQRLGIDPDFVPALPAYLKEQAETLLKDRKIRSMPDLEAAIDRELLAKARAA